MIPILYKINELNFVTRGLGPLYDTVSCIVSEELNGDYSLELKYPVTGMHANEIQNCSWIQTSVGANHTEAFRVDSISKPLNGIVTVHALQSGYSVLWTPCGSVWKFGTGQEVLDAVNKGLAEAMYHLRDRIGPFGQTTDGKTLVNWQDYVYKLETDITAKGGILDMTPRPLKEVLMGDGESFVSNFDAELDYYGTTIRILTHRGSDKGFSFRHSVNVSELTEDIDGTGCYGNVLGFYIPKASDSSKQKFQKPVYLDTSETKDSDYYNQHYFYGGRTCLHDVGDSYTDNDGTSHDMTTDQGGLLNYQYAKTISAIPLQSIEVTGAHINSGDISLGDTVHVYVDPLGITVDARITETEWNSLSDTYDKFTIGVPKQSLSKTIKQVANS